MSNWVNSKGEPSEMQWRGHLVHGLEVLYADYVELQTALGTVMGELGREQREQRWSTDKARLEMALQTVEEVFSRELQELDGLIRDDLEGIGAVTPEQRGNIAPYTHYHCPESPTKYCIFYPADKLEEYEAQCLICKSYYR